MERTPLKLCVCVCVCVLAASTQSQRHVIPIAVTGGAAGDGTVAFSFPEQVARRAYGEFIKLKEAWDVVMDKVMILTRLFSA